MTFLNVNGMALPVADGTARERRMVIGMRRRAFDGTLLTDERAEKFAWSGTTTPLTEMVAKAIAGAVNGRGDLWPLSADLYSGKGLGDQGSDTVLPFSTAVDGDPIIDATVTGPWGSVISLQPHDAIANLLTQNQRDGTEDTTTTGFASVGAPPTMMSTTDIIVQGLRSLLTVGVNGDGWITSATAASSATAYTCSVYLKPSTAGVHRLRMIGDVGGQFATVTTGTLPVDTWTRVTLTGTTGGADTTIQIEMTNQAGGPSFATWADALQLEAGSIAGPWIDGSNNAIDLEYTTPSWLIGSTDLTVAMWARIPAGSSGVEKLIHIVNGTTAANAFYLQRINQAVEGNILGSGDAGTGNVSDNDWHLHSLVLRRNPETGESSYQIYEDGASRDTASPAIPGALSELTKIYIGHNAGAEIFAGQISQTMIVPWAATTAQITAWAAMGKAAPNFPRFYVDGDAVVNSAETVVCKGMANESRYSGVVLSSAFRNNARELSLSLDQV